MVPKGSSINHISSEGEGGRVTNRRLYLEKRQLMGEAGGHKIWKMDHRCLWKALYKKTTKWGKVVKNLQFWDNIVYGRLDFWCSIKFFKLHFSQIPIRKCWNHNANIEQGKGLPKTRGGGGAAAPKLLPYYVTALQSNVLMTILFSLFSGLLLIGPSRTTYNRQASAVPHC